MVIELGYTNPHTLPEPLLKLRGMKKIFQFHFNQKSNVGHVDFVIDKIMEITESKESEIASSTVQEQMECIKDGKEMTTPASMINKRKFGTIDKEPLLNSAKHIKRSLFQEKGKHSQLYCYKIFILISEIKFYYQTIHK